MNIDVPDEITDSFPLSRINKLFYGICFRISSPYELFFRDGTMFYPPFVQKQ